MRKIESKLHSLMNSWTTTKETFYSLYVKFVNHKLIHCHKIPVKFIRSNLTHDENACFIFSTDWTHSEIWIERLSSLPNIQSIRHAAPLYSAG